MGDRWFGGGRERPIASVSLPNTEGLRPRGPFWRVQKLGANYASRSGTRSRRAGTRALPVLDHPRLVLPFIKPRKHRCRFAQLMFGWKLAPD
jgi:hypothetical protein